MSLLGVRKAVILGGAGKYEPEAQALFRRFAVQPTAARKALINDLIKALKDAGVWTKLDALYLTAAADSQAARRNWIADVYNLTAVNSPTFTTDQGYTGNASTSYLNSNFNPVAAGSPNFVQNSGSVGGWTLVDRAAADMSMMGSVNGTSSAIDVQSRFTGNLAAGFLNDFTATTSANSESFGHYAMSRIAASGAGARSLYKNGSSLTTTATASTGLPNVAISILARARQGSTPTVYSSDQIAAAHIGAGLTAADISALYAALQTYLTALGAI